MEGSAATAPAAADAQGQVQAPPAPEAQPTTPAAPETSPQADVIAQMDQMRQEIETLREQLGQGGEQQGTDLLSALQGSEEDLGFTPEELAALQAGQDPNQIDPGQQEAQLAELTEFVKSLAQEAAQEATNPLLEQREVEQVQMWQKDHPDVKPGTPMFDEIVGTMENLKNEFGDKAAMSVPLLDMAYTAVKAKLADAGAVPAEQAGANGASLETGAGQTQVGEDSEADAYRKALTSGAGNNPFA
jgi:hypothetical protein